VHRPTIHLVCPLSSAIGGSERRTLNYLALLSPYADVTLWTDDEPHEAFAGYPLRRLDPQRGCVPEGGTLILVGIFVERRHWLARTRPERLIIVYNTPDGLKLSRLLDFVNGAGLPQPELVFCSEKHRASTQLPGFVDWGLYDFESFKSASGGHPSGQFTVGRLSRDYRYKHHPQDIRLYRQLLDCGMRVRLMGASALREHFDGEPSMEVLDTGQVTAISFLQSLNAFVYRTSPAWPEPAGRVVVEAMACELPVVVDRAGGYSELIDHGSNGFLFDTREDAVRYLSALRSDPALARRVGRTARSTVLDRFGHPHLNHVREFYLRPTERSDDAARRREAAAPLRRQ
jgi:glycosyltransferase involved in cell wall biosynthesis